MATARANLKAKLAARKAAQTPQAKTARRKARADALANDPAQLTAPLTPKTLNAEIDAATRLKFGAQEKQIADQQRASDEQQRRLGTWFDDYRNLIAQARQTTAQGYQQADQQIDQAASTDRASSASPEAQQALLARQALARSSSGQVASQGANANAYLANRESIAGLSKLQAQTGESNRKRTLATQLQDLAPQKADYQTGLRRDARTAERNNAIANATLGLNVSKAATDASAKKVEARIRKQALKNTAANTAHDNTLADQQFASTAEKDAYQRKNHLGPYKLPTKGGKNGKNGGPTRAQRVAAHEKWDTAGSILSGSKDARKSRQGSINFLTSKGVPAIIAAAAWDNKFGSGISDQHRRKIKHRYGLTLPKTAASAVGSAVDFLTGLSK